ncbi:uncharacterized protein BDV17DRAFT_288337 [Aspergillus undulatus]|uniref:uncharacterized protein n=1 Tax=Aspergillus undulatus TaxID=1810928 RepID=UPI003CCCF3DC
MDDHLFAQDLEQLSVIHCHKTGLPTVVNHSLHGLCSLGSVPGALGYTVICSSCNAIPNDKRLIKKLNKGIIYLENLCHLLGSTVECVREGTINNASIVTIGNGAIIAIPQNTDDKQKALDTTNVFTKLRVQYSNALVSTQYFYPRSFTESHPALKGASPDHFDQIEINTGLCLFSRQIVSTSPGHGGARNGIDNHAVPPVPKGDSPALYELEAITRLSSAIADIVGLVGAAYSRRAVPIRVDIDIPEFQYYWTACDLLGKGLVTVQYVWGWIAAVDRRREQLGLAMKSVLQKMLVDRNLLVGVEIGLSSETEAVVALVKEKLSCEDVPSLEEVLQALRSRGEDPGLCTVFLNRLDSQEQPSTMDTLSWLIYVFKSVKPALAQQQRPGPQCADGDDAPDRRLIFQVDNVNEWKIFDRARSYLKHYARNCPGNTPKSTLLGLFPVQKVFVAGTDRSDLYIDNPGCHFLLDAKNTTIGPLDVISRVYGRRVKQQVQDSCAEVGFQ